jgi:lipopolysaccharide biosynthesis glycosyltransferase
LTEAQALLRDPRRVFAFEDQTALNAAFDANWKPVDPRWNVNDYLFRTIDERNPFIHHFTATKPWQAERSSDLDEFARWYADQTAQSPWPEFVQRRINDEDYARGWWKTMRKNARRFRINRLIRRDARDPDIKRDYLIVTGRLKEIYDLMIAEAAGNGALRSDPQAYFE